MKQSIVGVRWLISAVLVVAIQGTAVAAAQSLAGTVTNDAGQVIVSATPIAAVDEIAFTVVLDTHVVNLDGYDLVQLAVLRTADGREIAPTRWDAPAGGHHREGILAFPLTFEDGTAVLDPGSNRITVVVRDIAGVPERQLLWSWQ